ncbi:MAG: YIP1 family protein [Gemmatimonadaceae bacterium]|nr:YIP1 family protein [Gemmatimonadaceae bacterium]MCW5825998.1 YIP1 family protein [Gemmatimonadaceae bacterium]
MTAPDGSSVSTPPQASLAEDLIDIWFAPSTVFARRAQGGAWGPFLVTAVLMVALYFAALGSMPGVIDAEVARAVAEAQASNPALDGEQLETMRKVTEKAVAYGGLVFIPVVLLLIGVLVWLLAKVLGGSASFGAGVMIASFAYLPKTLELLLVIVQGFVFDTTGWTGRYQFSWGVGRFLDPTGAQGMVNFLGRLDVFTLWVTALCVIGLIQVAKVPRSKAYAAGAILWTLGALPALMQLASGK